MRSLSMVILMVFLAGCTSIAPASSSSRGIIPAASVVPATQGVAAAGPPAISAQTSAAAAPSPIPPKPDPPAKLSALPDLGLAPELTNKIWLNTDRPLRLADLEGKVVLLDMWTFG